MKKRAFSLIEIAISLPLIAFLFSFLLLTFTRTLKNNHSIKLAEQKALENHYFQRRLGQKLSLVAKNKDIPDDFLKADAAQFFFYNGISLNPKVQGKLFAKLFLDKNTLKLHLYKNKKGELVREEELLKDVTSLKITYFYEERNPNPGPYTPVYTLIENPEKTKGLTWVALNLNIEVNDVKKDYFFNLKR